MASRYRASSKCARQCYLRFFFPQNPFFCQPLYTDNGSRSYLPIHHNGLCYAFRSCFTHESPPSSSHHFQTLHQSLATRTQSPYHHLRHLANTMWKNRFRAAFPILTTTPLLSNDPEHVQFRGPPSPSPAKLQVANTSLTVWECTTCGRRYEEPCATTGLFIAPPPCTPCTQTRLENSWTDASDGVANLGGATCDYVRIQRDVHETHHLNGQYSETEDSASTVSTPSESDLCWARDSDRIPMRAAGDHGRVSRYARATETAADQDEDEEDCDFWEMECNDIDCIYKGKHRRHQCAMAEVEEEPKTEANAPKRGLGFLRSATSLRLRS